MEGDPLMETSERGSTRAEEITFVVLGESWKGVATDRVPYFPHWLDLHSTVSCAARVIKRPDTTTPWEHAVEFCGKWTRRKTEECVQLPRKDRNSHRIDQDSHS